MIARMKSQLPSLFTGRNRAEGMGAVLEIGLQVFAGVAREHGKKSRENLRDGRRTGKQ